MILIIINMLYHERHCNLYAQPGFQPRWTPVRISLTPLVLIHPSAIIIIIMIVLALRAWMNHRSQYAWQKLSEWKTNPKQSMTMMISRLLLDVTINNLFSPPDVMSCKVYFVNWPNLQMFPIVSLFLFEGSAVTYICRLWILGEGPYKKKLCRLWSLDPSASPWGMGWWMSGLPTSGGWVVGDSVL